MAKLMIFIDGTWLYKNMPRLGEVYGQQDFRIDFGKLPLVLSQEVARELGSVDVDVVRTYLFGSYASNYDLRDDDAVQRRLDFFDMLKEEHNYELELFPINFRGRRVRRADRAVEDTFEPKEKCVDISLATAVLYYASIPYVYDVAIVVAGDQDFKPVLQHVRKLGKRVAIASIKGSCTPEYSDPRDEARVKDFGIIWLDDLLDSLALKYTRHQLECQSPMHKGDRLVWTTFYPRRGQRFYCPDCQTDFARQKQEYQSEYVSSHVEDIRQAEEADSSMVGGPLVGVVKKKVADRGFGFIQSSEGQQYFFHLTDLESDLEFQDVEEGLQVEFEVKKEPNSEKAGAAQKVRKRV